MKSTKTLKQLIMDSIPAAYDQGDITEIEYEKLQEFAQELDDCGIMNVGDVEELYSDKMFLARRVDDHSTL